MEVYIKSHPNYFVNEKGEVYHKHKTKIKQIKPNLTGEKNYKYQAVKLSKDNKAVSIRLNRLVYFSFNPDADTSLEVHHKDGDKFNNALTNLELVSKSKNCLLRTERSDVNKYGKNIYYFKRFNSYRVTIRTKNKKFAKVFKTIEEAREYRDQKIKELVTTM